MEVSPRMQIQTVLVGGQPVHYSARPGGAGSLALVGVNGLAGGGDSFWAVIAGIPAGVQVVLPDLPGCGDSAELPGEHTVAAYAHWLEDFRAVLGLERLVLTSVATGAPITVRYAGLFPDRVAGLIFHLPMLGKAAVPRLLRPPVGYALRIGLLHRLVDRLRRNTAFMERIIAHEPPAAVPELAVRDIAHKQQASLRATGDLLHDLMLHDYRPELAALRVPMLFLAAAHDPFAPLAHLEALCRRPERRLYVEHDAPHSWNEPFIEHMNAEIAAFFARLGSDEGSGLMDQPDSPSPDP